MARTKTHPDTCSTQTIRKLRFRLCYGLEPATSANLSRHMSGHQRPMKDGLNVSLRSIFQYMLAVRFVLHKICQSSVKPWVLVVTRTNSVLEAEIGIQC